MSQPFVGEIRMVSFNFPPAGWLLCNGQQLAIASYNVLYQLIGTTYGGDGLTTFCVPNLQGRVPIHQGTGPGQTYVLGMMAGAENITLAPGQLPPHTHTIHATTAAATTGVPTNGVAATSASSIYSDGASNTRLKSTGSIGFGDPVQVLQPVLCVNFVIAYLGIFPSQS